MSDKMTYSDRVSFIRRTVTESHNYVVDTINGKWRVLSRKTGKFLCRDEKPDYESKEDALTYLAEHIDRTFDHKME